MKLFLILALIINVNGYGDIPEEGMDLVVTQAEIDPMKGEPMMSLNGDLLADGQLDVTITRSQSGIVDEFCCANQCTTGNKEMTETRSFTPSDIASWYIHYSPAPDSDVQITYHFADNSDSRDLRVHYIYSAQGIEQIKNPKSKIQKILLDGHVYIISNHQIYQLL